KTRQDRKPAGTAHKAEGIINRSREDQNLHDRPPNFAQYFDHLFGAIMASVIRTARCTAATSWARIIFTPCSTPQQAHASDPGSRASACFSPVTWPMNPLRDTPSSKGRSH